MYVMKGLLYLQQNKQKKAESTKFPSYLYTCNDELEAKRRRPSSNFTVAKFSNGGHPPYCVSKKKIIHVHSRYI